MLKARAGDLLMVGLNDHDLDQLKDYPISFHAADDIARVAQRLQRICIFYGPSDAVMRERLVQLVTPAAIEVVPVPRADCGRA